MSKLKNPTITFYNSTTGVEWTLNVENEEKLNEVRSFLNKLLNIDGTDASLSARPDNYIVTSEQYAEVKQFVSKGR